MPTPDQTRLMEDRARPRVVELWRALRPLASVVRFMQSGAHPDDEDSAMLAALAFRDGLNLSYACSTRGEGGQNDIGTEAGADLGALRTREMERACDVLGMRMYWHSESPDDPITDFGFSKSGIETLGRWGRDRVLARFVEIVRTERPDILCPTFLDVPGQHGHHRAMTQVAHEVMAAAADPAFPSNLPVWEVGKLVLPAWSGAGRAYDDEAPPPPETFRVDGSGRDPVTGWSWARIGEQSRAFHRTQGMGRWVPADAPQDDWPLHLAVCRVAGGEAGLTAGLPRTLGDLADLPATGPAAAPLREAGEAVDACLAAFPDTAAVADHAVRAHSALRAAMAACPAGLRGEIAHRIEGKLVQTERVLQIALGVELRARVEDIWLRAGDATEVAVESEPGSASELTVDLDLPDDWETTPGGIGPRRDAAPSDPYASWYDPDTPRPDEPALRATFRHSDVEIRRRVAFEAPPVVLPARTARLDPEAAVINTAAPSRPLTVALRELSPESAAPGFDLPPGWAARMTGETAEIAPPGDMPEGLYRLVLTLDGTAAATVRRIAHPHVAPTARARPAEVRVRVLEAQVPDVRIGYVGAGNDRVGHWLGAMGADVADLSDADLGSDATLAGFGSIVIGIFAMRFRPGLLDAMPRLHRWIEAGGTLVTLYHRPWDNWDPARVPPRRLEIGQPSLRWRVTDETAEVRHIADHPVLRTPNVIGPEDWAGWVKERGLYFAKGWDAAYTPLVEMADPDEPPHRGALLVAEVGKGRHVHCALILHHQMENLIPGAFRIMANLVARRA